jgi:hypothetical protein
MKKRMLLLPIWACVVASISYLPRAAAQTKNPNPAPAQPSDSSSAGPCKTPKLTPYTISPNSSGETVEGPACVQASPVNTLRNLIFISTAITLTAGPSPASIFPASGDKSVAGAAKLKDLDALEGQVRSAQRELRLRQDDNRVAAAHLDDVIARLREFVSHSDDSVAGGHFDTLITQIKAHKDEIDQVIGGGSGWKAADDIVKMVHTAQDNWANYPVDHATDFTDAATKTDNTNRYNALKTQLDDLETKSLQQASGSDAAKAIGKNMGILIYWRDVLAAFLDTDGKIPNDPAAKFIVHQDVPCRTAFNMNRSTAVKLSVGDRLPVFDGQQISPQTHDAFVTVTCTSPFSLSAGVAFSSIEQREFAIVQSAPASGSTTPVNKFGYASKSAFHPLPLAMAHLRFWESDDHRYAVHATFGVAANIQGSNAGGSSADYLPGLSFSLFRTMYLTAGVHIGKQASLAGGFNVGDVVPTGITTPPLQTSYKVGAGFAVTFTKP